jgi:benzoyl-CoA reductase/2-hydroxyglutaryl-CoA dehydratase subunit BcrC/BadD/HgdB
MDYYELLLSEMKQRVAQEIAAVPGERWRFGWDNIPIWFKLRQLSEKFAEHKACLVAATYAHSWAAIVSPTSSTDPLTGMAEGYTNLYINSGLPSRARLLAEMVTSYALDGFVMHSDRSCRAYSFGQYDLARILAERHGIPTLIIEADMCDSRVYADEQVNTRIEAFMETLAARGLQR